MAITLSKKQTISLEKSAGNGLGKITLGLDGWDFKAIGTTTRGRTADDLVKLAGEAMRP